MLVRRVLLAVLVLCVAAGAVPVQAKKYEYFGARFKIGIGAFFSDSSTDIRLDSAALGGTTFSFENDLGLDKTKVAGQLGFQWHISRRSNIILSAFRLHRSGTANSRIAITIPDPDDPDTSITIAANVEVDSLMNTDVTFLSYGFSIINRENAEFGVRIGFHVTDIKVGLSVPSNPSIGDTSESVTAPLPTIGFFGGYQVGKRIQIGGDVGWFDITLGDFKGKITDAVFGFQYQLSKLLGLGASYQYFEIDIEANTADFGGVGGEFQYRYAGPAITLTFSI